MEMGPRQSLERCAKNPNFEDLSDLPNIIVDLRYGSLNNILRQDVYEGFQRFLLHKIAAEKFREASRILGENYPLLKFIIFDALRPHGAQKRFWELVKDTPQQAYFADPAKGSIHSFGFAIDLSLADASGAALPMGTEFDDLSPLAEPVREMEFLAAGKLTSQEVENRRILREVMEGSGFLPIPREWWHFDALPPAEVRARFELVQ